MLSVHIPNIVCKPFGTVFNAFARKYSFEKQLRFSARLLYKFHVTVSIFCCCRSFRISHDVWDPISLSGWISYSLQRVVLLEPGVKGFVWRPIFPSTPRWKRLYAGPSVVTEVGVRRPGRAEVTNKSVTSSVPAALSSRHPTIIVWQSEDLPLGSGTGSCDKNNWKVGWFLNMHLDLSTRSVLEKYST